MDELKFLNSDWYEFLKPEFNKDYFKSLKIKVESAFQGNIVYPPMQLVFNAFNLCPLKNLKVILIGQDPYHGPKQANGLSFSVNPGLRIPPSLKNIFKELEQDLDSFEMPNSGDLSLWAQQGVLLLNSILTVEANLPGSHKSFGWENFTDAIIEQLSEQKNNLVFMLWGNYAMNKAHLINSNKHLILKAAHPSPLARGAFFGCKHFSQTNNYLISKGKTAIDWRLHETNLFS